MVVGVERRGDDEFLGVEQRADVTQLFAGLVIALAGVVAQRVVDIRAGQAMAIDPCLRQRQPIARVRQGLQADRKIDAEDRTATDFRIQRVAHKALLQRLVGGDRHAADVVEDDLGGRVLRAEGAVARADHAAGLRRSTAQPDRPVGNERAVETGMVEHVAPDLVGTVGDAVGVLLVGGKQQQARRFQRVAGNHEAAPGGLVADLVVVIPVDGRHPVLRIRVDPVGHGFSQYLRTQLLGRFDGMDAVVHRADRADRLAVVVAAAGGPIIPGRDHAALRNGHQVVAVRIDHLGEHLVTVAPGDHVGQVGLGSLGRALLDRVVRPGDAHGLFRAAVVGLDVVVADRPIAPYPIGGLHLEVHRQVAPAGRGPVPGGATHGLDEALVEAAGVRASEAHVVVGWEIQRRGGQRRLRIWALEVAADASLEADVAPVFDDVGAMQARARFEDQNRFSGTNQLMGDQCADDA
ncbi:hypothetical protein D3C81_985280 [compost metagenome]